jgi:type II secretory pathway component HofQ
MVLLALMSNAHAAPYGDRFDIELQNADLHATIHMLADLGDLDVVVPDTVYGRVSLRLSDVTWETALAAVLSVEGLGAEATGPNTVRVRPLR